MAKRKRPPNLDLSSIWSWQPRQGSVEEAPAPQLRQGSPRRNSCPLQPIAASPAAPERLIKRARRPGLAVRWRTAGVAWLTMSLLSLATCADRTLRFAPQRCYSVPDFGAPLEDACESLALRDDAQLCSPTSLRSAQAEQMAALSALSAQMGSSSLYSPARTSARSSPDSVDAAG